MKTFADAEAVLATALPGYERRQPQQNLAEGIERMFAHEPNFAPPEIPEDPDAPIDWAKPGIRHFLGQAGTGCVAGDTRLTLADGSWVRISEVSLRSPIPAVASSTEMSVRARATRDVFFSGVKPTHRMITEGGYEVVATADHRFLTPQGWMALSSLEVGQDVAVSTNTPIFGSERLAPDELTVLAFLLCDGSLGSVGLGSTGSPRWTKDDPEMISEMVRAVAHFGCKLASSSGSHTISRINRGRHAGRNQVGVLLEAHGLAGCLSKEKVVPEAVFRLQREQMGLFLGRLWSGDGCVETRRKLVSYSSASRELVYGIQHLLSRFGILGRVRRHDGKIRDRYYPAWTLEVSGAENIRKFADDIGVHLIGSKSFRLKALVSTLPEIGNPNIDLMPLALWDVIDRARQDAGVSWYRIREDVGVSSDRTRRISRNKARQIADLLRSPEVKRWADSDLSWLPIASIETDKVQPVYDVTMAEGEPNFLAGSVVAHNCGKSMAYLIPCLLSGRKIVVSVTTKALQEQLARKDMPFLETHLGVDFSWAMLKGRSNYLCVNRFAEITKAEVKSYDEIVAMMAEPGFDGLKDTIDEALFEQIPLSEWNLICADSDECKTNDCKPENCYGARARARAADVDLVIVNHALLFTDLTIKREYGMEGMLGDYEVVIFDESQDVEDVAASGLGGMLTHQAFVTYVAQANRYARTFSDQDLDEGLAENLRICSERFFESLSEGRITDEVLSTLIEPLANLADALMEFHEAFAQMTHAQSPDRSKASRKKESVRMLARSLTRRLNDVISAPQTEVCRWVEIERMKKDNRTRNVLRIAPIEVAPILYDWLFKQIPCVLVSATLMVKGSFDHITNRLGVPSFEGIDVGTPFDYPLQGRIYIPAHMVAPQGENQAEWQQQCTQEISALLKASGGRALVLFTSYKHMQQTEHMLGRMNPELDIRMQGSAPVPQLVDWLKSSNTAHPGRVVLATKSFFTGVDIPGEALSLVIVTKMPFPRPGEPLMDARCDAITKHGGSAFNDYQVPVMSLVLQQAVGRLIRHRDDRGVVAVLDPRLHTKNYGKRIIRDLPPFTPVGDIAEVSAFLAPIKEAVA